MISALDSEEGEAEEGKVCTIVIIERAMHFWTFPTPPRRCHREKTARTRTVIDSEISASPARVSLSLFLHDFYVWIDYDLKLHRVARNFYIKNTVLR